MAIPDYQSFMLLLLKYAADNQEHSINDAIDFLSKELNITDEERNYLLPSGTQFIVDNRVGWAKTYLLKAGLLESTRRGFFKITQRGLDYLKNNPSDLNTKILIQFEEFKNFRNTRKSKEEKEDQYEKETTYKKMGKNVVVRPEIQKFVGALAGQKANKGIFITTSYVTKDAEEYAKGLSTKLILIDGEKLADLMIEYNVGVSIIDTIQIKKIDSDYFNIE
jgi:restriction endonuclease Mrr